MSTWRRHRSFVAELLGTLGFTAWVAWPFLRTDRWVVGFDTVAYTGPNLAFTRRLWSSGTVPMWNDEIFGGVPHLANPQSASLYPLKLLTFGLDTSRSVGLLIGIHFLLLAVGLVVLVHRRLGWRAPAGLIVAVAVVGSGALMTKSIQFEQIMVVSWAPWLLVTIDQVLATRSRRAVAGLAVVTALTLVAGHPQIVYLLIVPIAGWALVRALHFGSLRLLVPVATGGMLGAVIALPQLVPTLLATSRSAFSAGRSLALLRNPAFSVDPRAFPQAVLGDLTSANQVDTAHGFEGVAFIGASVAFLCVLAGILIVRGRVDRRLAVMLVVVGAGAASLSIGPRFVLYRIGYAVLPGFDQARVPARWIVVVALCAALLAGMAVDAWRRAAVVRSDVVIAAAVFGALLVISSVTPRYLQSVAGASRGAYAWWGIVVVAVAMALVARGGGAPGGMWRQVAPVLLLVGAAGGELGALSAHSLGRQLGQRQPLPAPEGPVVEFLRSRPERSLALTDDRLGDPPYLTATLRPNTNVFAGIRSLDGYDGGVQVTRRWVDAMTILTAGRFDPDLTLRAQTSVPLDAGRLARLGVRWVVVETASRSLDVLAPGWPAPVVADGSLVVLENPSYLGPAVLRYRSQPVGRGQQSAAVRALSTDTSMSPDVAVIETDQPALPCPLECGREAAAITKRSPGSVDVAVDGRFASVLTIDEQFSPGWEVTVDDARATPVAVDGLQLGVEVPWGRHAVRFRYRERGFRASVALSVVGLLAVAALVVSGRRTGSGRPGASRSGEPGESGESGVPASAAPAP